jgi:hypothetical protein
MKVLGIVLTTIGAILLAVLLVNSIMRWYDTKVGCGDYLKLAGDAPTVQKAYDFLEIALDYMEKRGLTNGNSAVLFRTPSSDIGIWYNQVKGAKETLTSILAKGEMATQLEKDNALMKVREVVLDQGEQGTKVTMPANITLFPMQVLFWVMFILGGVILIIGVIVILRADL